MRSQIIILLSSIFLPLITAQASADGLIVPFTSGLPACASLCGKLFDVQGACVPPQTSDVSTSCFCTDNRLKPFANDGTSGVSSVCTTASCTTQADLQSIKSWYESFCNIKAVTPTTTSSGGATPTGTGSTTTTKRPTVPKHQTWVESHWKWIIMLVVLVFAIVGGWLLAVFLRRRYLRKKEKEFEMRSPVAWGPHQMQGATGGYGDGAANSSGGHNKEAGVLPTAEKPASKRWLRKERT